MKKNWKEGGKNVIVLPVYDSIPILLSQLLCCHIYNGEKNSIMKGTLSGHCHEGLLFKQLHIIHSSREVIVKQL